MSSQVFTLAETALKLDVSERTVLRLIQSGKLIAEKKLARGKRQWIIEEWSIARLKLLDWADRQMSHVPPLRGYQGNFGVTFVYGKWGEPSSNERLPTTELTVSLDELWRFAFKSQTQEEYESTKAEIRTRLPGQPENFQVRYLLDDEAEQVLWRIVKSVPPYRLASMNVEDLQREALLHLIEKSLPSFRQAKRGWVSYLRQSVRNFYKDKARQQKRIPRTTGDLADVPNLEDPTSEDLD